MNFLRHKINTIDFLKIKKLKHSFFFLHIPKTAGTTFRHVLYNSFHPTAIFPNRKELTTQFNGKYPEVKKLKNLEIPKLLQKENKIICGHYPIRITEIFPKNCKILVFYRNPLDRIISQIWHLKTHNSKFKNYSIDEIISDRLPFIGNLQANMSGIKDANTSGEEIYNILSKFDFIGNTEKFQDSLDLCNETFGWKLRNIKKENKAKSNYKMIFNEEQIQLIKEYSSLDQKVYRQATKIFTERKLNK